MRNILLLACALSAAACVSSTKQHVQLGVLATAEVPPEPTDVAFEPKDDHVWVTGRWARVDDQWVWQDGHHEPARDGYVWCNGFWDRKDKKFVWVAGSWEPARPGWVFEPGHFGFRGRQYVWIRDRWEEQRPFETWIHGSWEVVDGVPAWNDGHWEESFAKHVVIPSGKSKKQSRR